jgi:hypothetical protein
MRLHPPSQHGGSDTGPEPRTPAPGWQSWLETVGLVTALIVIGTLVDRSDPFLLRRGFSWFALAPLLTGLQYGSTHGLAGAALQAAVLAIAWKTGIVSVPDSAAETVLGWLVAGLLAGEFRDSWLRRATQLESFSDHLRGRLEGLGRSYLALKISHDRLRRSTPAASATLRDALSAFRRELSQRGETSLEACGEAILQLFAEHAFVRSATLHAVDRKGRPGPAIAALGSSAGSERDPLVRRAARTGVTMSVRGACEGDGVLVAVPLVDLSCRARAVVAVHDLPFTALHAETLELLAVIGGQLGDAISRSYARSPPLPEPAAAPAATLPAPEVAPLAAPVPAPVKEVA